MNRETEKGDEVSRSGSPLTQSDFFNFWSVRGVLSASETPGERIRAKNEERFVTMQEAGQREKSKGRVEPHLIKMFVCGDVMTGRGIDQVLPCPSDPVLYEPYIEDARQYMDIAERMSGPIPRRVDFSYIWGDATGELDRAAPDLRLINLETSVTESDDYWKGKGINYRMHPKNGPCLTAARIDFCSLANNHVLDWGYSGLKETLKTLRRMKLKSAGAGLNLEEAESPALLEAGEKGRVVVFAFASETSGVPRDWGASENRPGVNLLEDLSEKTVHHIREKVKRVKQRGDIVVASIHWGGNWGYGISEEQKEFAHSLIDYAGIDVIHGHSSHHAKGIEVYRGKPVLHGCGDFLNDYEGISGYEDFRDDLGLMYLLSMQPRSGELIELRMIPTQIKRFRINPASQRDLKWLRDRLDRECQKLGARVELSNHNAFSLKWN
jgi:poly-gamma-glutamate capsule biosynthesis protein CapA/YwtB (metallophosphatase superfamily)